MSESYVEVLRLLAADAEIQKSSIPAAAMVCDEIANYFGEVEDQLGRVNNIAASDIFCRIRCIFEKHNGIEDDAFWTRVDSLEDHKDWQLVRRHARSALEILGIDVAKPKSF